MPSCAQAVSAALPHTIIAVPTTRAALSHPGVRATRSQCQCSRRHLTLSFWSPCQRRRSQHPPRLWSQSPCVQPQSTSPGQACLDSSCAPYIDTSQWGRCRIPACSELSPSASAKYASLCSAGAEHCMCSSAVHTGLPVCCTLRCAQDRYSNQLASPGFIS